MEAKCGYCELMGKVPHCFNCKMLNKEANRPPRPVECSLNDFVEAFVSTNSEAKQKYVVGDWIDIKLTPFGKIRITYIDSNVDKRADSDELCSGTFMISRLPAAYSIHSDYDKNEIYRFLMPLLLKTLPKCLLNNIKTVDKTTSQKLWLFSESEYTGINRMSVRDEDKQYAYFKKFPFLCRHNGVYIATRSPVANPYGGNICGLGCSEEGVVYSSIGLRNGSVAEAIIGFCL